MVAGECLAFARRRCADVVLLLWPLITQLLRPSQMCMRTPTHAAVFFWWQGGARNAWCATVVQLLLRAGGCVHGVSGLRWLYGRYHAARVDICYGTPCCRCLCTSAPRLKPPVYVLQCLPHRNCNPCIPCFLVSAGCGHFYLGAAQTVSVHDAQGSCVTCNGAPSKSTVQLRRWRPFRRSRGTAHRQAAVAWPAAQACGVNATHVWRHRRLLHPIRRAVHGQLAAHRACDNCARTRCGTAPMCALH